MHESDTTMKTLELPYDEVDGYERPDEIVERPRQRTDGRIEVIVQRLHVTGMFDHYYVSCAWYEDLSAWICDCLRHEYYESLHTGQEKEVDHVKLNLTEEFGASIRSAFGVAEEKISPAAALHSSPSALEELSHEA